MSKDSEANALTESVAKLQFFLISHTMAYLHQKNICHRDLKLENIILMSRTPTRLINVTFKLCGCVRNLCKSSSIHGHLGGFSVKHPEGAHIHMQVELLVHGCGSLHA